MIPGANRIVSPSRRASLLSDRDKKMATKKFAPLQPERSDHPSDEDRQFHSSFDRMFGNYLNHETRVEREFDAAMARLQAPGPLAKLSKNAPASRRAQAAREDFRIVKRAIDAMGALIEQVQADVAHLSAQRARELEEKQH
jgi:hypothetical protein